MEIHWYEGAGHAFNCDMRAGFQADAAAAARTRALAFLSTHLT
ncbi:MAG: dienelactone hydrolase family protein [Terracidiphilus sp.]